MIRLLIIVFLIAPFCLHAQNKDSSRRRFVDTTHQKPMSLSDTLALRQFDGSTLHIVCNGASFESYCETLDGYTLALDKIGIYEYAKSVKSGDLVANGTPAKDEDKRTPKEKRLVKRIKKHLRYTGDKLNELREKEKMIQEDPAIIKRYKKKP